MTKGSKKVRSVFFVSKFWEDKLRRQIKNLPLKFGYFHFSVSTSTFLTASWLLIFVSAELSQTIISTDRFEPRLECHAGGKIKKTLKND